MKLLHLASGRAEPRLFTSAFRRALSKFGELSVVENASELPAARLSELIRDCDVLLTGWGCAAVPPDITEAPGRLRYVCHLTGSLKGMVPIETVRSAIPVTNWGTAPAFRVAEGALALLLAALKLIPDHVVERRAGRWNPGRGAWIGSMKGLRLGLYGFGAIAREFARICEPLQPRLAVFDPFARDIPAGIKRADSLDALFGGSDAVAIHAGLTDATQNSVNAALLAKLPDGGIVINTARGAIIDQDALFSELARGRLRAGLDVLSGDDRLPAGHPARSWSNLILSGHVIHTADWPRDDDRLDAWHEVALENLESFSRGGTLKFRVDPARYELST